MKKNMGSMDRIIRSMAALVMLLLYLTNTITGTFGIILVVIAAVFLLTSFGSFCPLYVPFGLSSAQKKTT